MKKNNSSFWKGFFSAFDLSCFFRKKTNRQLTVPKIKLEVKTIKSDIGKIKSDFEKTKQDWKKVLK